MTLLEGEEMTLPDDTVIPPTGKAFDLELAQTSKWDGDRLIVISAFWDAALQAQQLGTAQARENMEYVRGLLEESSLDSPRPLNSAPFFIPSRSSRLRKRWNSRCRPDATRPSRSNTRPAMTTATRWRCWRSGRPCVACPAHPPPIGAVD
jgi:hypothetical protein